MTMTQLSDQSYAFGRDKRLLQAAHFSYVFNQPSRSSDQFFTILAKKNHLSHPRLGLAIAKKNLKKAHDRNLIKRIIRESFRLHQHDLSGLDVVVMIKQKIPLDERKILHDSLSHHWKRITTRCAVS